LNNIQNEEIKDVLKSYRFELHDLRDEISPDNDKNPNKFLNNYSPKENDEDISTEVKK